MHEETWLLTAPDGAQAVMLCPECGRPISVSVTVDEVTTDHGIPHVTVRFGLRGPAEEQQEEVKHGPA